MAGQPEAALESNRAGCMVRRTCEFIALRRQGLQPLASSFVAKTLGGARGFAGGIGGSVAAIGGAAGAWRKAKRL